MKNNREVVLPAAEQRRERPRHDRGAASAPAGLRNDRVTARRPRGARAALGSMVGAGDCDARLGSIADNRLDGPSVAPLGACVGLGQTTGVDDDAASSSVAIDVVAGFAGAAEPGVRGGDWEPPGAQHICLFCTLLYAVRRSYACGRSRSGKRRRAL
eukprot:CAMPEP_0198524320 /NCGR_PEP_ID=MMETSP1462-20131121/22678_1 /TAXON_ID=1333877 /ORGANISM="Brandtodinium nutriculum, Strain RCC3387" /LENGTH=156 /DNA_ID=CAMNT_0044254045 /DNA_START=1 /DNA_END=471 /DNA_ORIENTATION=+